MKLLKKMARLLLLSLFLFPACYDSLLPGELAGADQAEAAAVLVDAGTYYVFGGDILLDKADPGHQVLVNALLGEKTDRGVMNAETLLWPAGEIPYYFDPGETFTAFQLEVIAEAMQNIQWLCGVNFYETTPGDYRYQITKTTDPNLAGSSTLGYTQNAVYHFRSSVLGVVIHELLHGLGMHHEHQRWDRDQYISILLENVEPGYESQFAPIPESICNIYTDYDYESIMHYNAYAFTTNGEITIDSGGRDIGQRLVISEKDAATMVALYGPPEEDGRCEAPVTVPAGIIQDGAGQICLRTESLGDAINSWELDLLTINGFDFTNRWVGPWDFPVKNNGYYYINYQAASDYGHFEITVY